MPLHASVSICYMADIHVRSFRRAPSHRIAEIKPALKSAASAGARSKSGAIEIAPAAAAPRAAPSAIRDRNVQTTGGRSVICNRSALWISRYAPGRSSTISIGATPGRLCCQMRWIGCGEATYSTQPAMRRRTCAGSPRTASSDASEIGGAGCGARRTRLIAHSSLATSGR